MTPERRRADALYRVSFGAFVYAAFEVVNPGQTLEPNWHIDATCYRLQTLFEGGGGQNLVLNMPPRSLKSFITSVCLPAWLLGRDPTTRLICASYSEYLAHKFSRDCRVLLESGFYKRVFSKTRPRKATEGEFETTLLGSRLATSVDGTLTGRGGDVLIIDDPLKANEAGSAVARQGVVDWFRTTALSRLDNQSKSVIIVTMQRLHRDDLSGILIEAGWPSLVLPAIASEAADYPLGGDETYHRLAGEVLQVGRDSLERLEALKQEVGSHVFSAQYQQSPTPPEGNMIRSAWLGRYEGPHDRQRYRRVVLSCDPAGKSDAHNDFTAITICGIQDNVIHVLHVVRGHWTVMEMQDCILALVQQWRVDLAIIEDTSSGMGLIQFLRERPGINVIGRTPKLDKETRMTHHQGRFEASRILLPKEAAWLAEFESELLAFPHDRHDDQVDALLLFLDWFSENECLLRPVVCVAPFVGRVEKPAWITALNATNYY